MTIQLVIYTFSRFSSRTRDLSADTGCPGLIKFELVDRRSYAAAWEARQHACTGGAWEADILTAMQ